MRNPLSSFSRVVAVAGLLFGMTLARGGARADQVPPSASSEKRDRNDDKQSENAATADRNGKSPYWPLRITYVNTGIANSLRLYDASGKVDDKAASQLD